ncbi:MAG: CinA family protein [Gammaproteobacteria bacterium]|nr:CinA family protein [Gammaproteobacteria bacterium]MBU0893150.1 CinA family protein [Gammaproteobacteria bacterium]MBU1818044.1 CinA family protein [Gammaproteobacteria bacterium]
MTTASLSKNELPALDHQALDANLTQISLQLLKHRHRLATAESCTGGMIASACTDLSGASDWFDRGFVTYSNAAKTDMLGVPPTMIEQDGAVSEAVARAMADGALIHSQANVSLAVTGVAGPTGGSDAKPVGTVWFAWCVGGETHSEMQHFAGDRAAIRAAAVRYTLQRLLGFLLA